MVNAVVFGATGMVGQGVLRECLLDSGVDSVLTVGRTATGQQHPKLRELVPADLFDLAPVANELTGLDACFFCLGVSSAGMKESDLRAAIDVRPDAVGGPDTGERNPGLTFVYVSGTGTDSSAQGRSMWARVKGMTENALLDMPFHAYMFRPGYIQPMHGVRSRTRWYAAMYAVIAPLYPLLRRLAPKYVTTTEMVGRAMITIARRGWPTRILATKDINAAAT